jgi:hypothetical protein
VEHAQETERDALMNSGAAEKAWMRLAQERQELLDERGRLLKMALAALERHNQQER